MTTTTTTTLAECTELQQIIGLSEPCPECDAPSGQPCEPGCYGSLGSDDMLAEMAGHLAEVHGVHLTEDEATDPAVLLARHQTAMDAQ